MPNNELQAIIELIVNNGMSVVIILYFLYKDYKFNENIINVLSSIEKVLERLETWHKAEELQE